MTMSVPPTGWFTGDWTGTTAIFGKTVHLAFHVSHGREGFHATLDCPAAGLFAVPVRHAACQRNIVSFEISALDTSFRGILSPEKTEISGFLCQGAYHFPLDLNLNKAFCQTAEFLQADEYNTAHT